MIDLYVGDATTLTGTKQNSANFICDGSTSLYMDSVSNSGMLVEQSYHQAKIATNTSKSENKDSNVNMFINLYL